MGKVSGNFNAGCLEFHIHTEAHPFKQFFSTASNIISKLISCFVLKTMSLPNKRLIRH